MDPGFVEPKTYKNFGNSLPKKRIHIADIKIPIFFRAPITKENVTKIAFLLITIKISYFCKVYKNPVTISHNA
jgi:hypothetical protein